MGGGVTCSLRFILHAHLFDTVAGMAGEMKIYSRQMAQTNILARTFREGMEPALPVIRARTILNVDLERKGFLMEHGLG